MSKNINPFDIDTYEPGSMNNETNQNQVTSPTTNTIGVFKCWCNCQYKYTNNYKCKYNGQTMYKTNESSSRNMSNDENHPENYDSFDINHGAVETMNKGTSNTGGGSGSGLKDKLMTVYNDERDLDTISMNKEKSAIGSHSKWVKARDVFLSKFTRFL